MKSHFFIGYSELIEACQEKYQKYKQLRIAATKIIEALIDNDDIKVKTTQESEKEKALNTEAGIIEEEVSQF